jgi:hypothetical protein
MRPRAKRRIRRPKNPQSEGKRTTREGAKEAPKVCLLGFRVMIIICRLRYGVPQKEGPEVLINVGCVCMIMWAQPPSHVTEGYALYLNLFAVPTYHAFCRRVTQSVECVQCSIQNLLFMLHGSHTLASFVRSAIALLPRKQK